MIIFQKQKQNRAMILKVEVQSDTLWLYGHRYEIWCGDGGAKKNCILI